MNPPAVQHDITPYLIPCVFVGSVSICTFDEAAIRAAITLHRVERTTNLDRGTYSAGWHANLVLDPAQAHTLGLDRPNYPLGMYYSNGVVQAWARVEGEVSFKGMAKTAITKRRAKLELAADVALTPAAVAAQKEVAINNLILAIKGRIENHNHMTRLTMANLYCQIENWTLRATPAQQEAEEALASVNADIAAMQAHLDALKAKADAINTTIFAERKKSALNEMATTPLPVGIPEEWRACFLEFMQKAAPTAHPTRFFPN